MVFQRRMFRNGTRLCPRRTTLGSPQGLASLSGESSREMTGCELAEDLEPQDFSRIAPHSLQL